MFRKRRDDCCDHREEKRKQALKQLQRKIKRTKDRRNVNTNGCEEDEEEIENQGRKCEDTKPDKLSKPPKYVSIVDEMIGRIQPSMEDREKCSATRHARCFLEPPEIEKSKYREKTLTQDSKVRKKDKTMQGTQSLNNNGNKNESGPKDEEQKEQKRRQGKNNKVEPWCPELKEKKKSTLEFEESKLTESDCEDSICSFDSQINLSGLSLTKEEHKMIEDLRRNRAHSQER